MLSSARWITEQNRFRMKDGDMERVCWSITKKMKTISSRDGGETPIADPRDNDVKNEDVSQCKERREWTRRLQSVWSPTRKSEPLGFRVQISLRLTWSPIAAKIPGVSAARHWSLKVPRYWINEQFKWRRSRLCPAVNPIRGYLSRDSWSWESLRVWGREIINTKKTKNGHITEVCWLPLLHTYVLVATE